MEETEEDLAAREDYLEIVRDQELVDLEETVEKLIEIQEDQEMEEA